MSTNRSNTDDKNNRINAKNSTTVWWPFIGGIAVIAFSILLLELRAIIPSLIIMLTGISLFIYWIYITKTKSQGLESNRDKRCLCTICDHTESNLCIQQKCICCSITKGDKVVGHTNNPLQ